MGATKIKVLAERHPHDWDDVRHLNYFRAFNHKGAEVEYKVLTFTLLDALERFVTRLRPKGRAPYWCLTPHHIPFAGSRCVLDYWKPLSLSRPGFKSRERRLLNRRKVKAVVVDSELVRDYLVEAVGVKPEKITVLPTGVDTELFKPVESQKYGLNVGYVGSLTVEVYRRLLEVMEGVWEAKPTARLMLVGGGINVEDVRKDIRVVDYGKKSNIQVPAYLKFMDVCIGDFDDEPRVPVKLLEYMAAGKPVVASKSRRNHVVEEAEAGFTCASSKEMAEAVVRLLESGDEARRLGKNGRDFVLKNYDVARLADRYLEIFRAAVG